MSNILARLNPLSVTGVIDFSSAHADDPAVDFAAASTLGEDILEGMGAAYPEIESALGRVAFYRGTFALQEALFGVENGDMEALRAGLAGIPSHGGE